MMFSIYLGKQKKKSTHRTWMSLTPIPVLTLELELLFLSLFLPGIWDKIVD